MGFFRTRLLRRFPRLGLAADLALVGSAASRLFRRGGQTGASRAMSAPEMALAGGAAFRLLGRLRRRRKARRLARAAAKAAS